MNDPADMTKPWDNECRVKRSDFDFEALYADDSTRPIVHALVAAIGYINGQSINSAAVMIAELKIGLKALEKLQEQKAKMRDAIGDARRDIAEWVQLAERQYDEMPSAGFQPLAPTVVGIEKSKALLVHLR